jgi:hypothetical protein
MVIIPLEQVKFMQPPPNIFSAIRLSLPRSTQVAFTNLDEMARHNSPSAPATNVEPQTLTPLSSIAKELETYALRTLNSATELTYNKTVLDTVWARTTEAALKLHDCTIGSTPIIDTLQTSTLSAYRADWYGSTCDADGLRAWIKQRFEISSDTWQHEQEMLEIDMQDTRDKSRLISAIRTLFELDGPAKIQQQNANRFLCRLYPELEGAFDACHITVSATLFFFELPHLFSDNQPTDISHAGFNAFCARLKKFKQWQFSQFPMFGFLCGDDVEPALITQLAERSGLAPNYIRRELGRVIGFLPLSFAERYLVHDIWGHSWQASMLRLEGLYQQLSTFDDNFSWNVAVVTEDRTKLRLSDCLQRTSAGWKLQHALFAQYLNLWIWNRIPTAMAPLVAELVADLFEHKLYWTDPELYPKLQTTSILPDSPAKIDLMLADLRLYFQQIVKPLELFCKRDSRRQTFAANMISDGISPDDAAAIVADIKTKLELWQARELAAERILTENDAAYDVNLFGYLEHHVTQLGAITSVVANQLAQTPTGLAGLSRWNDWFALLIAVYFEQDPTHHFWQLPQFVHNSIYYLGYDLESAETT